jgi:hypothetical protein
MATETIELEVDPETARRYREAETEERARLRWLFSLWMRHPVDHETAAANLRDAMRETGRKARENGLTAEILEDLLRED